MQNLSFFKTEFGIFQLQAPGNPALVQTRALWWYYAELGTFGILYNFF